MAAPARGAPAPAARPGGGRRTLVTPAACDDARANLRSLESGQRIGRTNEAGERVFLNDAERESRLRELRGDLASRC